MTNHSAIRLRCEYLTDPLGIDAEKPRLFWQLSDSRRGARQSAYQVLVAINLDGLAGDRGDVWDSGKIDSDQSAHVVYQGTPLKSGQRCFWKVRTWDAKGQVSDWSQTAFWEMGLLKKQDWHAKWIGSPVVGGPYSIPPAPYLRKDFAVQKPIARARLYATALGLYLFEINGQRVGVNELAPGRTEYRKRVPYHTYDVTALLKDGPNACGAILGDGWYCGHVHSDPRQTYGDRPRLLAQIEITFTDGSKQLITSDQTWRAGEGPIRSSDLLMGEDYDARMNIPGWSSVGFDDSAWRPAIVFEDPDIEVVANRAGPIRCVAEIKPIAPPKVSANKRRWLFDLGQNIVGRVRMKVRGPAGKVIDLRHCEMLDKDGKPYTLSLRTARSIDHYTTNGSGEEIYEPYFTFHGFRYVEVRDYPGTPTIDDLTGIVLQSEMESTGTFECSDPMINKLQSNILWSQRGNFLDIPTDCPQRDERLGWTGDAQVFIRTAAFNMDVANFFAKWLTDMADSQGEDGRIPSVVPSVDSIYGEGGPAWADAAVICPWTIYLCYGDTRILEQCYPMMQRFMKFLQERCVNFIRADQHWKWKGYGDWLSMNAETPADFIGTAFYAHCSELMSRIATLLNRPQDASNYGTLFEDVRNAWQKRFVNPDGQLNISTQTAHVLALHFDLLPESLRPAALAALVKDIECRGMHLSTGFVGTPYLNHVLTRFGRPDIAFALLHQTTFPSWLYPITQGATTMWERWDSWTPEKGFSDTGMNSFNHYAYGAIGEWIYSTIGGIDLDPAHPGYKHIVIRPRPSQTLTHARATLDTLYGRIESAWHTDETGLHLKIVIPANSTATVYVPTTDAGAVKESKISAANAPGIRVLVTTDASAAYEVGSGSYVFHVVHPMLVAAAK
jgi:alpha-L-rhamnosidase